MIDVLRVPTDADWRLAGHCSDLGDDTMFPLPANHPGLLRAKAICVGCPVQAECRTYADRLDIRDGIWGGLTAAERGRPKRLRSSVGLAA